MLRVAYCYKTVSHEAALVVSSMPPLKLLAEERIKVHQGVDRKTAGNTLMTDWQTAWNNADKGR